VIFEDIYVVFITLVTQECENCLHNPNATFRHLLSVSQSVNR